MNKKLARLVLAAQRDIAANGLDHSYTMEIVAILIIEYLHKTPRADEMYDLVSGWRSCRDYIAAVALASWLLAQ